MRRPNLDHPVLRIAWSSCARGTHGETARPDVALLTRREGRSWSASIVLGGRVHPVSSGHPTWWEAREACEDRLVAYHRIDGGDPDDPGASPKALLFQPGDRVLDSRGKLGTVLRHAPQPWSSHIFVRMDAGGERWGENCAFRAATVETP